MTAPYDATVEDRHEHGFTFREGLGYLADDPFCDGCCELATAQWKSAWQRPVVVTACETCGETGHWCTCNAVDRGVA